MKKEVFIVLGVLVLLNIVIAVSPLVTILNLNYDKGTVSVQSLAVSEGYFNEPVNKPEVYELKMLSCNGNELYSQNFEFELEIPFAPLPEWFDEQGNQIYFPSEEESKIIKDNAIKELILPYYKNLNQIKVYSPNNELVLIISANLEGFCKNKNNVFNYFLISSIAILILIIVYFISNKAKNKSPVR